MIKPWQKTRANLGAEKLGAENRARKICCGRSGAEGANKLKGAYRARRARKNIRRGGRVQISGRVSGAEGAYKYRVRRRVGAWARRRVGRVISHTLVSVCRILCLHSLFEFFIFCFWEFWFLMKNNLFVFFYERSIVYIGISSVFS